MAMFSVPDFSEYLRFCCSANLRQNQQDFYTPISASLRLQAQSVVSSQSSPESNPAQEEKKRMDVLVGLRQYAPEHILLVGKPGSGKSTALKQLLWESAQQYLETEIQAKRENLTIPVLLELRDCREGMVLDWLHRALRRANLTKDTIETLLSRQHFLLLFDGLNELPSSEVRAELGRFRRDYADVPMVFTTRELGAGEDLGIKKKLEMVPLSEVQMRRFIEVHLPGRADALLKQLQGRLQELTETPLLLWMLCEVFAEEQQIPRNRGELFRRHFTQKYDQFKQARSLPISEDSRRLTAILLQQLAFEMMQGNTSTKFRLQITISEARQILEAFLRVHGEVSPASRAGEYLEDLLEFHILQLASDPNKVEFHHQFFQEYYAAECLLPQLSQLNNEQLKCHYLNYLKWTESIALALSLVEDPTLAVRVVKLAVGVDLNLGARLAGEVQSAFQEQTAEQIIKLQLPLRLKAEFLVGIQAEAAIPVLTEALKDSDIYCCVNAVEALGQIGSEKAVRTLLQTLTHPIPGVCSKAIETLGNIGGESLVRPLLEALTSEHYSVRSSAAIALGRIGSERAIDGLLQALTDVFAYESAAYALGRINSGRVVDELFQMLKLPDSTIRERANLVFARIDSERAINRFFQILENQKNSIDWKISNALESISSERAVDGLLRALQHQDSSIRQNAAKALHRIGNKRALNRLLHALKDKNSDVRISVVQAVGEIGDEQAVYSLLSVLQDQDAKVRLEVASALGKIGSEQAVESLLGLLRDKDWRVRMAAANALGEIGSEKAVKDLLQALKDRNESVRRWATFALCQICSDQAFDDLLRVLGQISSTHERVVKALVKIDAERAVDGLLKMLKKQNTDIRKIAAEALGETGSERAIDGLLQMLQDAETMVNPDAVIAKTLRKFGSGQVVERLSYAFENMDTEFRREIRLSAVRALGKIGSDRAVASLLEILQKSEDELTRRNTVDALEEISSKKSINGLLQALRDKDFYVRKKAASALGEIGDERAVDGLIEASEDPTSADVRIYAAMALKKISSESSVNGLLKILYSQYLDEHTPEVVACALGKIGNEKAISGLLSALHHQDSVVREKAALGLGEVKGEVVTNALVVVLQDHESQVSTAAAYALGKLGNPAVISHIRQFWLASGEKRYGSAISTIQNECHFYNHETYLMRERVKDGIRNIKDEEVRQLIYHIESVGNLNTGTVIIQGNQTEIKQTNLDFDQ